MLESCKMGNNKKQNGGKPARIGLRFDKEIEDIKVERINKRIDKEKISTEKISNLIVRNKLWPEIKKAIVTATKEEVEEYGLE